MKFQYRPCETTRITSGYGYRTNPITKKAGTFHAGIDISPIDKIKYFQEPIFACSAGKVKLAEYNLARGNQVLIDHGSGIVTRSQHLASITVKTGDTVDAGQIIGRMGNTGNSTAQHLHFEVIVNAITVDPQQYIDGLPNPKQLLDLYRDVQLRYGFTNETMEYLKSYKYAESLFTKMLLPIELQTYQLNTVRYILNYKFGKEIFEKLHE